MRRLPFPDGRFDTVVCADNSLPHLLTGQDVHAALAEMRRVLRPGGLLLVSTRHYDDLLRDRPASTPPQVHGNVDCADGEERTVTFQLWHWHDDGEHYDLGTSNSFQQKGNGGSRSAVPLTGRSPGTGWPASQPRPGSSTPSGGCRRRPASSSHCSWHAPVNR